MVQSGRISLGTDKNEKRKELLYSRATDYYSRLSLWLGNLHAVIIHYVT